jgi:aldehyde dehydrogenase (NAD+)
VSEKHFARLAGLLDASREEGAVVALEGANDPGNLYFHPVVLKQVDEDSAVMEEEIFGPILPVIAVRDLKEAESIISHRPKPLALYIFSDSCREIERLLASTSSGGVCVNDCAMQFFHTGLPFGGVGGSGFGKAHGHAGFMTFSNEKSVIRQRHGLTAASLLYPPHTARKHRLLTKFMALFYR